jgi:hypothetical protein
MVKVAMDLEAMKAEFAARGGKPTVVESGVRAIESDRTIYRAMREGGKAAADMVAAARNAERREERAQEAFREALYMGAGRDVALQEYNTAKLEF